MKTSLNRPVRGTAGCGKSVVASQFAEVATTAGKRVLLVCFNRPLAERMKMTVPKGAHVDTFYGITDEFLISRGHKLPYERIGEPGFWEDIQGRVIGETIGPDWKFDALIVDEGQDFEEPWSEILRLFLKPDADLLWLEDFDQSIRRTTSAVSEPAYKGLHRQFIGFHARENYLFTRDDRTLYSECLAVRFCACQPSAWPLTGTTTYKAPEEQGKRVAAIVTNLIRAGFKHNDIVILSMRGLKRATLTQEKRVGTFSLSRPTGEYDLLGNQLYEIGQLRFDTVYRFKGQQAPAIILTDVDPDLELPEHADRLLFTAMTRATLRLEIVFREGNVAAEAGSDRTN